MSEALFSNAVSWEAVFVPRGQVVCREIAGETLLVPIRGRLADMKKIFALNPVAAFIWRQVDGKTSLEQIRDRLVECFEVGREEAGKDAEAFVRELLALELLEVNR